MKHYLECIAVGTAAGAFLFAVGGTWWLLFGPDTSAPF